eukprot:553452_1
MNQIKKQLIFGYIREYCDSNSIVFDSIPHDIIKLFLLWVTLSDHFDKYKCHPDLILTTVMNENPSYESIKPKEYDEIDAHTYASAIGQQIIYKGQKQKWMFQLKKLGFSILIGIVDNVIVECNDEIGDFTNSKFQGYGICGSSGVKYNGTGSETKYPYALRYDFKENDKITMILDLTEKENKNGILSFIFHADTIQSNFENVSPDATPTNIAYDDIDINKAYRCAIALHTSIEDEIAMLL